MGLFGRKHKPDDDDLGLPGLDEEPEPSKPPKAVTIASSPGAGVTLAQILAGVGPVGELVREIRSDPQGFRERMLQQAQASGRSAYVVTPQGLTPIGHPADEPVPTHVDVIDQLTKAADLHDKGQLTDAEFEQLKHKLLGG
jgi:hypothetical protein